MLDLTEVILYSCPAVKVLPTLRTVFISALPLLLALFVVFAFTDSTFAQETPPTEPAPTEPTGTPAAPFETGNLNIEENPIYVRLVEIINFLSIGVGIVVAISVAVGGFQYMASRGDPGATSAAIKRLNQAATAIALYVFGWAILNWLIPGGILN